MVRATRNHCEDSSAEIGCKMHNFELLDLAGIQGTHQDMLLFRDGFHTFSVTKHGLLKAGSSKLVAMNLGKCPILTCSRPWILKSTFPSWLLQSLERPSAITEVDSVLGFVEAEILSVCLSGRQEEGFHQLDCLRQCTHLSQTHLCLTCKVGAGGQQEVLSFQVYSLQLNLGLGP